MTHSAAADLSGNAPAPRSLRPAFWLGLIVPLVAYTALALAVGLQQSERLNPDGVCYLRMAEYLAQGDFANAVSTYWSPLFGWSMAPLIRGGIEGLDAARLMQLFWGGALLIAFHAFLRNWTRLPSWAHAVIMLAIIPAVVDFEIFVIAPDVALSAWLLAYFAALGNARWRATAGGLVAIGLLGGTAYWLKAYALPFILVHLPLSIVALNGGGAWRQRLRAVAVALFAFALPVAIWITAISWKAGHPTMGASGAINHAVVGPPDVSRYHPVVFGVPSPPHISIWETPEKLPYQFWSPFQSREYLRHQGVVMARNAGAMVHAVAAFDQLWLGLAVLILLFPLGWILRADACTRRLLWWTAGTIVLYLSGYLLVAFEPRYANSLLLPLLAAAAGQALFSPAWRAPRWVAPAGLALLAASLLWRWAPRTERNLTVTSPAYMQQIADGLRSQNFRGPFASTSWYHGTALAYFTGQPSVGFPPDADPALVAERLRQAGVDWIVVWDMPGYPPMPVQDLFPPTIPRALEVVANHGEWELAKSARVPFGNREAKIYAFHRVKPDKP